MKTWIRALFFLNAVIWTVFAAMSLIRNGRDSNLYWLVGLLMLANAAVMLALGLLARRDGFLWRLAAVGFLLVNSILTFTDQVGAADLVTGGIDLLLLVLVLLDWRKDGL